MSQMLGKKQMFFLYIVLSVFTLTVLGFYLSTTHSDTFFDTNLIHNNSKGELLSKWYHNYYSVLSNSASANHQSTSISKNQKTLSETLASNFQNQSAHTETGNESQNLQGFDKLNAHADTKLKTAKQAEKADAATKYLENLKPPSHPKLLDSPSSENKKNVAPTPDPLYIHHGYISVVDNKKKLNLHCLQCAYVSSSGQLLNSGAGYLIDEADCVFRMNNAPASGYEEDVGSRTTVRVIAHSSTPHLKQNHQNLVGKPSPAQYVVGWGPAKPMSTSGSGYAFNTLRDTAKKYKEAGFFYLTQEQMNKADEVFEAETGVQRMKSGIHLSTGWFTMLLARQVCDEIHVYGMINDQYCQVKTNKNVPYHYYNSLGLKECDYYNKNEKGKSRVHRFITEKAIFARWALQQPPMYFHNPFWNP